MRSLLSTLFLVAAALILPVPISHAATEIFTTSLSGANEVPTVASSGTGFVTVTLDTTAKTLLINASFMSDGFSRVAD
jgi:CHRD domain